MTVFETILTRVCAKHPSPATAFWMPILTAVLSDTQFCDLTRRCCRTIAVKDSHRESMRLDELHEQAQARPLPHDKLVHLQRCAQEARVAADLAGQGDDLARAA